MSRSALARALQRQVANGTATGGADPFDVCDAYAPDESQLAVAMHINGNARTLNLDGMLARNIVSSYYFINQLLPLTSLDELIDEIYNNVTHVEPWDAGAARVASKCFCCLFRLGVMRPAPKDITRMLNHPDSPFIRAVAFIFLRLCAAPPELWGWLAPYVDDDSEITAAHGAMHATTMGEWIVTHLLSSDNRYYMTLLPRLPVTVARDIGAQLLLLPKDAARADTNRRHVALLTAGVTVRARYSEDGKWYEARVDGPATSRDCLNCKDKYWVTYTETESSELRGLGQIDMSALLPAGQRTEAAPDRAAVTAAARGRPRSRSRSRDRDDDWRRGDGAARGDYEQGGRAGGGGRSGGYIDRDAPPRDRGYVDRDAPRGGYVDRDAAPRGYHDRDAPRGSNVDRYAPRGYVDRDAPPQYASSRDGGGRNRYDDDGEDRRGRRRPSRSRSPPPPPPRAYREDDDDMDALRQRVADKDRTRALASGSNYALRPVGYKESLSMTVDSYVARRRSVSPARARDRARSSYHDGDVARVHVPAAARRGSSRSRSPPPRDSAHASTAHAGDAAVSERQAAPYPEQRARMQALRERYDVGASSGAARSGAAGASATRRIGVQDRDGEDVIKVRAW